MARAKKVQGLGLLKPLRFMEGGLKQVEYSEGTVLDDLSDEARDWVERNSTDDAPLFGAVELSAEAKKAAADAEAAKAAAIEEAEKAVAEARKAVEEAAAAFVAKSNAETEKANTEAAQALAAAEAALAAANAE